MEVGRWAVYNLLVSITSFTNTCYEVTCWLDSVAGMLFKVKVRFDFFFGCGFWIVLFCFLWMWLYSSPEMLLRFFLFLLLKKSIPCCTLKKTKHDDDYQSYLLGATVCKCYCLSFNFHIKWTGQAEANMMIIPN